jgi:hypothetical protein
MQWIVQSIGSVITTRSVYVYDKYEEELEKIGGDGGEPRAYLIAHDFAENLCLCNW